MSICSKHCVLMLMKKCHLVVVWNHGKPVIYWLYQSFIQIRQTSILLRYCSQTIEVYSSQAPQYIIGGLDCHLCLVSVPFSSLNYTLRHSPPSASCASSCPVYFAEISRLLSLNFRLIIQKSGSLYMMFHWDLLRTGKGTPVGFAVSLC